MTDQRELFRVIAQHLEAMADGREDGNAAMMLLLAREGTLPANSLIESAWANIQHFVADADIRARESDYSSRTRADLQDLASRLRELTR